MIIDVHNHLVSGDRLPSYQSFLISGRGFHGKGHPNVTEESVAQAKFSGKSHDDLLTEVGTDMAFISPRPFTMMHAQKPEKIVHYFIEASNDTIALAVKLSPDLMRGVAGLPQCSGQSPSVALEELERCVKELGFVGCVVNPDPGEGDGQTPGMGDEYWYPLYEKMVELDVPGIIHSAGCLNPRESFHNHFITEEGIAVQSLMRSTVFDDFPNLKLIVCHGGGSVPYQIGRWRALDRFSDYEETFDQRLQKLYLDTALYNTESLELLFKIIGPDNCLFGSERPGAGSSTNPLTGRWFDDIKPLIDDILWLSDEDRKKIYEGNARRLFTRFKD